MLFINIFEKEFALCKKKWVQVNLIFGQRIMELIFDSLEFFKMNLKWVIGDFDFLDFLEAG